MFVVPMPELLEGLGRLRRRLCNYQASDEHGCDCKYGATGRGEQSGCPEVRAAIELLKGGQIGTLDGLDGIGIIVPAEPTQATTRDDT